MTKDNLVHQGIYFEPKKKRNTALLWIHGLTGKFYSHPKAFGLFTDACEFLGFGFAAFHTRGHDYMTSAKKIDNKNPKGYTYVTIGASTETFIECVLDIDAAISFLVRHGFEKVVLIGTSTGANKACYYAAMVEDKRIGGVILTGPMSDRYSVDTDQETHVKHKAIMEKKIAEGKGDEILMGYDFFPLTPNRWMSLLGEGSPEDVFNYRDPIGALSTFEKIKAPLLVIFGGADEHADRSVREIRSAFDAHARSSVYKSVVIDNADHGFTGKEKELGESIIGWVAAL